MANVLYGPITVFKINDTWIVKPEEHSVDTWTLTIKVTESGAIEITDMTGDLPPGELEIRGSDDGNKLTLHVRQRDPKGRFLVSALHTRDRAEEALDRAEHFAAAVAGDGGQAEIGVTVEAEVPGT